MRISEMRNLGPTTERMLGEIGIETDHDLRRIGGPMAYVILKHRYGSRVNRLFLYALEGALQDQDMNDFSSEEKAALTESASGELGTGATRS